MEAIMKKRPLIYLKEKDDKKLGSVIKIRAHSAMRSSKGEFPNQEKIETQDESPLEEEKSLKKDLTRESLNLEPSPNNVQ